MKLAKKHIQREYEDDDGYWVELKPGWKSGDDPVGVVHSIREDSRKEACLVGVIPCKCASCVRRMPL
jgi:hypothetical protein